MMDIVTHCTKYIRVRCTAKFTSVRTRDIGKRSLKGAVSPEKDVESARMKPRRAGKDDPEDRAPDVETFGMRLSGAAAKGSRGAARRTSRPSA